MSRDVWLGLIYCLLGERAVAAPNRYPATGPEKRAITGGRASIGADVLQIAYKKAADTL
jgi:hypothetical protein